MYLSYLVPHCYRQCDVVSWKLGYFEETAEPPNILTEQLCWHLHNEPEGCSSHVPSSKGGISATPGMQANIKLCAALSAYATDTQC